MGCKKLDITSYYRFTGGSRNPRSGQKSHTKKTAYSRFKPVVSVSILNYRYYSSELGRWVKRDPIDEVGGYNLYGMCYNNPLYWWDYLGNDPMCLTPNPLTQTGEEFLDSASTWKDPTPTSKDNSDQIGDGVKDMGGLNDKFGDIIGEGKSSGKLVFDVTSKDVYFTIQERKLDIECHEGLEPKVIYTRELTGKFREKMGEFDSGGITNGIPDFDAFNHGDVTRRKHYVYQEVKKTLHECLCINDKWVWQERRSFIRLEKSRIRTQTWKARFNKDFVEGVDDRINYLD